MNKHSSLLSALLLCFISSLVAHLSAQPNCQIQYFSVYNGMAQRAVTGIVQDPKGFIWFSTWNGLDKFDGYGFKNYKAYPGDGCTLTSNRLYSIVGNQHCDIWCHTYDSRVYLFDSRNEKFIDLLQPIERENGKTYTVNKIYALPKGISWIVCDHEAFRVDERAFKEDNDATGSIVLYSEAAGNLPGSVVSGIRQDNDGNEWIFTDKGVRIIGRKRIDSEVVFVNSTENNGNMYLLSQDHRLAVYNLQTEQLHFEEIPYPYSRLNSIQSLGTDSIGISSDNGLIFFFAAERRFDHADIRTATQPSPEAGGIFKDSHNELWIFSPVAGITRYNPATGEKQHYRTLPQDMPKAERESRDVIFEDSQGTLWVVPHLGCISYYDRKDKQLKPYYTDHNNPDSKFTPVIRLSYIDNQKNLWFADNYQTGRMSFFPSACHLTPLDYGFETRAFLIDREQKLWTANKKGIIRIFNPDKSLQGYLTPEGNISKSAVAFGKNIYCFLEDEEGNIWLGSKWDGVFRLRKKGDGRFDVQQYVHEEADPYSLSNNSIYSIIQDQHKRIWIGTYGGGLNLFRETAGGKARFVHSGNELKGYPKDNFSKVRILREVDGALMVGTTEGLLTFSGNIERPEDIKFYPNTRIPDDASTLSSNDVVYIYTDSRKDTYVLTFTGGVNCILSDSLLTDRIRFKAYTKRDGLSSDLVLSMIEDSQKGLWIVCENVLSKFNPDTGSFDNFDEKYLQKRIYSSEAIPVLYRDRILLGTDAGILEIDPSALKKSVYTPPIAFTGLRIQSNKQNLSIDDLEVLKLKPHERNVTFEFAALDYIAPASISYSYRLQGLEENWNEADNNRRASYINLPPGEYELQIRSTNSDGVWTDNVRRLPIVIIPTFWETYWAWLLYAVLFILSTATIVYIILYIYKLRHQIDIEHQLANIKLRFFTDISHELRTPLTLITSPVHEVLEHETLSAGARKHLTLVHKNAERMLRLINQILDFRKIENKKMKLILEKTEVIGLLQQVMDNFRYMAEEKSIDFRLQTDAETIYAWIDRDKLEKIAFNLISNAFKYTPDHKSITVCARVDAGQLVVSVTDEGIGIDLQKQRTLFQRFETLVHSNILQPSSGIGLSLVKELVELHHGNIRVDSQAGVGSTFTITLPLDRKSYEKDESTEIILEDAPATPAEEPIPAPEQEEVITATGGEDGNAATQSVSVLIVEDNNELRGFLKDILSPVYKVIEATNGQEGVESALTGLPDLIISDIMMPVMDGLDMVKAIKENRDICHIPIILLSAKSSLDDRISGLEQGIDDYITKPFSSTYLKTRIKSLLSQRSVLQKYYLEQWLENQKKNPAPLAEIEPARPQITSSDEQFVQQVMDVMEKQMDNPDLTIDELAQSTGMGRTVFYQKLKTIFGLSPVDFVREVRIKRAMQLMESGEYNISTIAYMTGFNDPKYFSKCFKKKYGMTPSEFNAKRGEH